MKTKDNSFNRGKATARVLVKKITHMIDIQRQLLEQAAEQGKKSKKNMLFGFNSQLCRQLDALIFEPRLLKMFKKVSLHSS